MTGSMYYTPRGLLSKDTKNGKGMHVRPYRDVEESSASSDARNSSSGNSAGRFRYEKSNSRFSAWPRPQLICYVSHASSRRRGCVHFHPMLSSRFMCVTAEMGMQELSVSTPPCCHTVHAKGLISMPKAAPHSLTLRAHGKCETVIILFAHNDGVTLKVL